MLLLNTAYLPPIEYFALIAKYSDFCLEACENYQKQSYRNRCYFFGSGGKEMLQIPVIHENGTFRHPITDIRIDYSTPWVIRTQRALDSAYKSAAYFDYYRDGMFSLLESGEDRLWAFNLKLTQYCLERLGLDAAIHFSDDFADVPSEDDFRERIHPKKASTSGLELGKPYFQVFSQKHGFIPNLSVIDLLFNEGPSARDYLLSL
ncbi:MAG: WbqC family protein [Bacteroidales bacterium]|nr:WbqC family protein [Bacteroidales bacterium]